MHKHIYFFLGAVAVGFAARATLAQHAVFNTAYAQGAGLAKPKAA
jgi:hypothetical protein